ncbi:hypothetical protein K501DRAFT_209557 [Backusella circina FSU 941]|nr:hypothetical protein K501DRAFT_209557 [Backusella circina FSU 941]
MHFIPEACYRRPLEPKSLVYSRATTAIVMGMSFLAFCGYLASQIYNDKPLIYLSSETVPYNTQPADIEFCVQNSTMTIVHCSAVYYNWSSADIPDCYNRFFRTGRSDGSVSHCYVFETNGTYRMTIGSPNDGNNYTDSVRRFDFYWKIDSHLNYSYASASVPAIALQLYDPSFSAWKTKTLGGTPVEEQMLNDITLGYQHATTFLNSTSNIYYTPQKYREIRPGSARALLGFEPDYIDIITLDAKQIDWPLATDNITRLVNRSDYDGLLSMQLSKATIDVKTESRQHTLLAAIALAGGCYGVLTTIYILLFGMTRLTPWGLVHHIPVFISNHRHYKKDDKVYTDAMILESKHEKNKNDDIESNDSGLMDEFNNESSQKKKKSNLSTKLIPWFFRSNIKGKAISTDPNTSILERMMSLRRDGELESTIDLARRTSFQTDNDSRTQLPHASTAPGSKPTEEELNELSATSDFFLNNSTQNRQSTSYMKKTPASPKAVTSPTALFFNNRNSESNKPPFSPTITKRASLSSDIMPYDQEQQFDQLPNITQDSVSVLTEVVKQEKEKNKELATRVDELEVILSQYFINTAYLDQLRTKREQSFIDGLNDNGVKRRPTRPSNNGL